MNGSIFIIIIKKEIGKGSESRGKKSKLWKVIGGRLSRRSGFII